MQVTPEIAAYATGDAKHPARSCGMKKHPLANITRLHDTHRRNPSPGWVVRYCRNGKWRRIAKGLTDSENGGWEIALARALELSQRLEKEVGEPKKRDTNTGVPNLSHTKIRHKDKTYWGFVHTKSPRFSICYGRGLRTKTEARQIAVDRISTLANKPTAHATGNNSQH